MRGAERRRRRCGGGGDRDGGITCGPPRIFAVQMCPRFGWQHAWHRFLNSCPSSRSLRPFSIRCHLFLTDETVRPGSFLTMCFHLGPSLSTICMITCEGRRKASKRGGG